MAPQQQAQVLAPSQNSLPSTSPIGLSLLQQPSFVPQPQIPQIHWQQQPAFSQSVTNPSFNATTPSQGTLSPQTRAPFMLSSLLRHLVHLPDLHFSSQLKPRSNNHSLCSNSQRKPHSSHSHPSLEMCNQVVLPWLGILSPVGWRSNRIAMRALMLDRGVDNGVPCKISIDLLVDFGFG